MRFVKTIFLLLLLSSCRKDPVSSARVIGHAATGLDVPNAIYHDNSIEAIQYALALPNCSGVEVDVRRDSEGKLWLYHDEDLSSQTNLTGKVETSNTATLIQGYYNTIHQEALTPLNSTTLEQLAKGFTFLDIKSVNPSNMEDVKISLLALNLDTSKCALIVPSFAYYSYFNDAFPVYLFVDDFDDLSNSILANNPNLRGICIRNKNITREQVNFLKSIHKKTVIFEVRSPKGIREALGKDPYFLLTDDVKLTVGILH